MNDIQKVIVQSIYEHHPLEYDFLKHVKMTFPVVTICDMLGITRNHYYYLRKVNVLDKYLWNQLRKEAEIQ